MTITLSETASIPGPIDYLVVEFPPDRQEFSGEMAAELRRLAEAGIVRVLRLLVAGKDAAGQVSVRNLGEDDGGDDDALAMAGDIAALLADDDMATVTQRMAPGTVVGVVVWENTWAAGFVGAASRAGGRVAARGRIPSEAFGASGQ